MSFKDLPIIDRFSVNSESSERRFKDTINLKTGFLVRPERPDTGCDLNVEIVVEEQASGKHFPVQLKSIEKLEFVDEKTFIALQFETSRLGYLMGQLPAMGLIVFYSLEEDRCFYGYPDKIYERIIEKRNGSHEWKVNDTVRIHIPYANVLTTESAIEIHNTLFNRFKQAALLQNSYGEKYGLPTYNEPNEFEYDFRNPEHIKKFLQEYGMMLIDNYDTDMIFQMVTRIPHLEIYTSKELLILAALSYGEAGLFSDSQVFCNKLRRISLEGAEKLMVDFLILKNNISLGFIDNEKFLKGLEKLSVNEANPNNSLILKLNSLKFRMLSAPLHLKTDANIVKTIDEIFEQINASGLPEKTKLVLTLLNCENYSRYISHDTGLRMAEVGLSERVGNSLSYGQKVKEVLEMLRRESRLNSIIEDAINRAMKIANDSIKARAYLVNSMHFVQMELHVINYEIPAVDGVASILIAKTNEAIWAYNYFNKVSSFKEAFDSLSCVLEIVELSERHYHLGSFPDKDALYKLKAELEEKLDVSPRALIVLKILEATRIIRETPTQNGMPTSKDFTDEQIDFFSRQLLIAQNLPEDRFVNIVDMIKAFRMFHIRCDNPNIEIHQVPQTAGDKVFSMPAKFYLRNKATGIQTPPSIHMDALLKGLGY